MAGLEPLPAPRFVQPLLSSVARTLLGYGTLNFITRTQEFKLFVQRYYCTLGSARGRGESVQDKSSSKQHTRTFQPIPHPGKVLEKAWHGKTARIEMDGDSTRRVRGRDRGQSPTRHIHYCPPRERTRLPHPGDRKMEILPAVAVQRQCTANSRDFIPPPLFSVCSAPRRPPHGQWKGQCFALPVSWKSSPRAGHESDGAKIIVIRHHLDPVSPQFRRCVYKSSTSDPAYKVRKHEAGSRSSRGNKWN
ncbi:hypothetical protein CORC01_13318 [Colletotrichum orchidophilum]|uniref:Uncharacterized protein n=1 Tax=Colletotrichum orchidophilum TaxID=1209926 RepID=A0A1G4AQF1_9PEZI|nr:uncharacterized protein CORC01_13318 [Colletotrichum orchidophilum]OHE91400.1 hypothetical protein CORC01_13318 [Colletotrichum orchidophilum]